MSAPSLPTPSRRLVMLLRIMFQRAGSLSVTWNSARLRGAVVACTCAAAGKAIASRATPPVARMVRRVDVDIVAPEETEVGRATDRSERQADVVLGQRRR